MKSQALLRLVIGGVLILLFSLGCGIFSAFAPTATPAPTFTPTTIPTSTPKPTATPLPGPKPGTWSGPGAAFTLTEYGQIQDFELTFDFGDTTCTYTSLENFPVVDEAFAINITTNSQDFIALFNTDATMSISGTFEKGTSLSGIWSAMMCGEQIVFSIDASGGFGPVTGEWSASWQGPSTDSGSEACPYAGADDTKTFTNIIEAEEQSVLNEDMNIVRMIYADGATLTDVGKNQTWTDVTEHYQDLFDTMEFTRLNHFDIEVVKNDNTNAWVKATDSGAGIWSATGEKFEYENNPGSNHYIFEKDSTGCWFISHFSKDAAGERFP